MRSFRTHTPRDLVKFGKDDFFIKVLFQEKSLEYELQVGFNKNKKLVKLNQKPISSFKELIGFYRVITLTEDDLEIIKGGPDARRTFVDNAIFLFEPHILSSIRDFKKILENRNSLLQGQNVTNESYSLWTEQLWEKSRIIQLKRVAILQEFEKKVNMVLSQTFDDTLCVALEYKPKNIDLDQPYDAFYGSIASVRQQEMRFGRSLFGAHLDDFIIKFQNKKSKMYASRGQQKLIVLLLKACLGLFLTEKRGPAVFLLDDFMTDFDEKKAKRLIDFLLSLDTQLIFTSPCRSGIFENLISKRKHARIVLTH